MSTELVLYTTSGCHLCEEAENLLKQVMPQQEYPLSLRKVDIVESPKLMELYGIRIPVIRLAESEQELGWPFDDKELSDYLRSRPN